MRGCASVPVPADMPDDVLVIGEQHRNHTVLVRPNTLLMTNKGNVISESNVDSRMMNVGRYPGIVDPGHAHLLGEDGHLEAQTTKVEGDLLLQQSDFLGLLPPQLAEHVGTRAHNVLMVVEGM